MKIKIGLIILLSITACNASTDPVSVVTKWENNIREGNYEKAKAGYCDTEEFNLLYNESPYLLNPDQSNLEFLSEGAGEEYSTVVIKDITTQDKEIRLQVWETANFFSLSQLKGAIDELKQLPDSPMNDRTLRNAEESLKNLRQHLGTMDKYCVKKD
jgi:hypothetical protein